MNKLKQHWNITSNWQLVIIFIVFAITGSTAAYLSKPFTSAIGITKENLHWSFYWPLRLVLIFPINRNILYNYFFFLNHPVYLLGPSVCP